MANLQPAVIPCPPPTPPSLASDFTRSSAPSQEGGANRRSNWKTGASLGGEGGAEDLPIPSDRFHSRLLMPIWLVKQDLSLGLIRDYVKKNIVSCDYEAFWAKAKGESARARYQRTVLANKDVIQYVWDRIVYHEEHRTDLPSLRGNPSTEDFFAAIHPSYDYHVFRTIMKPLQQAIAVQEIWKQTETPPIRRSRLHINCNASSRFCIDASPTAPSSVSQLPSGNLRQTRTCRPSLAHASTQMPGHCRVRWTCPHHQTFHVSKIRKVASFQFVNVMDCRIVSLSQMLMRAHSAAGWATARVLGTYFSTIVEYWTRCLHGWARL